MTNCACNIARGIWSFIIGSLRVILFFGCLLMLLMQLIELSILFNYQDYSGKLFGDVQKINIGWHDYLHSFSLVILSIVGCYGAFYRHYLSIKVFSFLTLFSVFVSAMSVFHFFSTDNLHKINEDIADKLKSWLDQYQWQSTESSSNAATKHWNVLQQTSCCGIKSYTDWDSSRPDGLGPDKYPSSCCLQRDKSFYINDYFCDKKNVFKKGCLEHIMFFETITLIGVIVYLGFQFTLTILSFMVGYCSLDSSRSHHQNNAEENNFTSKRLISEPAVFYAPQQPYNPSQMGDYGRSLRGYNGSPPPSYPSKN